MFQKTSAGRIHYRTWGEGTPLVMLHGNGGSCHEFEQAAELLRDRFKLIAWDMPGQGDSSPLTSHMTVEGYSNVLGEFLRGIEVERAIVGGSSIGATIAADFAVRHAGVVQKVVLVELASRTEAAWSQHWEMIETMFSIPTMDAPSVAKRFVSPVSDRLLARWNVDRNKAGGKTMMDVMWAGREYDVESLLPKIACDALLIYGDKSPVLDGAQRLRGLVPNAHLDMVSGAAHFPMIDAPAQFARAVAQFLSN